VALPASEKLLVEDPASLQDLRCLPAHKATLAACEFLRQLFAGNPP